MLKSSTHVYNYALTVCDCQCHNRSCVSNIDSKSPAQLDLHAVMLGLHFQRPRFNHHAATIQAYVQQLSLAMCHLFSAVQSH